MTYFSNKIKDLRLINNILQKEIAEDLSIPKSTYCNFQI